MAHIPSRPVARVAGLVALITALLFGAGAGGSGASPTHLYLAIGDSLAAGYQPTFGQSPPPRAVSGFRDGGYPGGYAADVAASRGLELTDLGCPGETTASMVATPAQRACQTLYRSEFGASSQLAAAHAFLASHRGAVTLVTLDIGANDLDRCAGTDSIQYSCLVQADERVATARSTILRQLRSWLRSDDPAARLETMDYYDPFLALAERPGGAAGMREATESLLAVEAFDSQISTSAGPLHVGVAKVSQAFSTDSLLPLQSYSGKRLPEDVVVTCRLTWMCPASPKASPDIHPNAAGYRVIAAAFERLLPPLGHG